MASLDICISSLSNRDREAVYRDARDMAEEDGWPDWEDYIAEAYELFRESRMADAWDATL